MVGRVREEQRRRQSDSLWRCAVLAAAQLGDEHGLKGLHGRAYLSVPALLVEEQGEAVGPVPVLLGQDERVEARLDRVLLRPKPQATWQA